MKRLIIATLAHALAACGPFTATGDGIRTAGTIAAGVTDAAGVPAPATVADLTTADEQAMLRLERVYKAARSTVELAVDSGLVRGKLASTIAAGDRFAFQKLGALRRDDGPNLRFQQLMRAEGEALTTALVRALPMAGNACNAGALGADIYFWTDDTRTRWTFDYFGAAAPESLEETPE